MSRSIDSHANRVRRLAIQSGMIKSRTEESVEFDLDQSLYEAGAAPASVASRTGGWARHAQPAEPQDANLNRPIREVLTDRPESQEKRATTKKGKKQQSRATNLQPPSVVANVAAGAPPRVPIFDRNLISGRPNRAPALVVRFAKRPRVKAKTVQKLPNRNNLEQRLFKKWGHQMCCCSCRKLLDSSLWARHLKSSCSSLSLTRAEVRRTQKIAFQVERASADTNSASTAEIKISKNAPCGKCGKTLSRMAMEIHVGSCGKVKRSQSPDDFPFTLLPESISGDFGHRVRDYFLRNQLHLPRPFGGDWDWSRMEELEKLNPTITHYGRQGWFGYCVCEFSDTKKVLLESPLRNSATYVVGANWRHLISLTKPEIREGDHRRIFHVGHYWLRRVTLALS